MTRDPNDLDWILLARYVDGETTLDECARAEGWLAGDPALRMDFERLQAARARAGEAQGAFDHTVALHTVLARTSTKTGRLQETRRDVHTRSSIPGVWRQWRWGHSATTAGLIVAALLVVFVFRISFIPRHTTPSHTYTTTTTQRATVWLADGTQVTLAPQTTLTVSGDFGQATRRIALRGEAYFDIANAAGAPFIVDMGKIRAQVLGTAFAVRRYSDSADVQVAVVSGKVTVGATTTTDATTRHPFVVLSAGMVGNVTDSTATVATVQDIKQYTGWTNGQLVFHDAPVPQVLAALERWYGYQFRLSDSTLAHRHLSVTFNYGPAENMFMVLKELLDVTMTFDGTAVIIHPRRPSSLGIPRRNGHDVWSPQFNREVGR